MEEFWFKRYDRNRVDFVRVGYVGLEVFRVGVVEVVSE